MALPPRAAAHRPLEGDRWLVLQKMGFRVDLLQNLPAQVVAILDTCVNLPQIIDNLHERPHKLLHEVNGLIQTLEKKTAGVYDENVITDLISNLALIVSHKTPIEIFYPQVIKRIEVAERSTAKAVDSVKASALRTNEEELARWTEQAQGHQRAARTLLDLLVSYRDPREASPSDEIIAQAIEAVKGPFQEAADTQAGPVDRILQLGITTFQELVSTLSEKVQPHERPEWLPASKHPLMHLVGLIDEYQKAKNYPQVVEANISNAIRELEISSPLFMGIEADIQAAFGDAKPSVNLPRLQECVERFVRERLAHPTTNAEFQALLVELSSCAGFPEDTGPQEFLENTPFWAVPEGVLRAKLSEVYVEWCKREIQLGPVGDGAASSYAAPSSALVPAQADNLWSVVAQFEELVACKQCYNELTSQRGEGIRTLANNLDRAIDLFEKNIGNLGEEGTGILQKLADEIFEIMGFARKVILAQVPHQEAYRKKEIEKNFENALILYRKEEYLAALKLVKQFIQEDDRSAEVIRNGEEIQTPLTRLEAGFKAFKESPNVPLRAPKVSRDVLRDVGEPDAEWNPDYLTNAIRIQTEHLIDNALVLSGYKVIARLLDLGGNGRQYHRIVQALKTLAGDAQDYPNEGFQEASLRPILGGILNLDDAAVPLRLITKIQNSMAENRRIHGVSEASRPKLRKALYFSLMEALIEHRSENWAWESMAKVALFFAYSFLQLFVEPFATTFIEKFQQNIVLEADGELTDDHLKPVKALTKALGGYVEATIAWPEQLKRQHDGEINLRLHGGSKKDNMKILLGMAAFNGGETPESIARNAAYTLVDRNLQIANLCNKMSGFIRNVERNVNAHEINNPENRTMIKVMNTVLIFCKKIISILIYVPTYAAWMLLKALEIFLNFSVQQVAKLLIWQGDYAIKVLDMGIESLFQSTGHAAVFDNLVLEQLTGLKRALAERGLEEPGELSDQETQHKQELRNFFVALFQAIHFDNYLSPQQIRERTEEGLAFEAKKKLYSELSDLLASALITTSKSVLNKDQLNVMLYKLLQIANEGLQRGQAVVLDSHQKEALADRLGKDAANITEDEVVVEARRIKEEASQEVPKLLKEITDLGINPAVDEALDRALQTPSQILLEYISWIEESFFANGEDEGQDCNLIPSLRTKLHACQAAANAEDRKEALRKLHAYYTSFTHQLTAKQSRMDGHPTPNTPELNKLINIHITPSLEALTGALDQFLHSQDNQEACLEILTNFETRLRRVPRPLRKIQHAEETRIMGMHSGISGIVLTALEKLQLALKDGAKKPARALIHGRVSAMTARARNLYNNDVFLRHVAVCQLGILRG